MKPIRTQPTAHAPRSLLALAGLAACLAWTPPAPAQDQPADPPPSDPAPADPAPSDPAPTEEPTEAPAEEPAGEPAEEPEPEADAPEAEPAPAIEDDAPRASDLPRLPNGRRMPTGETTTVAFKNVTVDRIVPFIVESTGKAVLPRQEILSRRITILSDQPMPQVEAVDYVFSALHQEGIAVVETFDRIILRDIAEVNRQDVPVIGPGESVLGRRDIGVMAEKVFALGHSQAEKVAEIIEDSAPDYAKVGFDADSNQIVVMGNIGLLQRIEGLVNSIDRPSAASVETRTFVLKYADAEQVAENIKELYEGDDSTGSRAGNAGQRGFQQFFGGGRGNEGEEGTAAPSENLRVTANVPQNAVTVLAEPAILQQVADLIATEWDRPIPRDAATPRIYDLQHSDPVRVEALLEGLFGSGDADSGATGGGGGGGFQGQGGSAAASPSQAESGVGRLKGQFTFQAIPEASRLVVVAKSPENLYIIDEILAGVDQPQTAGLPEILELKHANAEELAEQLNALLSREGTLAQIPRQETGLTDESSNISPFAQPTDDGGEDAAADTNLITFWWQRAQPPTDNRGASNIVGRIRFVPVWRQNAVMVLSPPEYRAALVDLVEQLDRPGRQVLISAVVAEVSLDDATALGLRWSSETINPSRPDNAITVGTNTTATENDFLGNLFDTSVLNVDADLNLILQALNEKAGVNILSEPKIFTADNQEAEFFDGQDIPFVTEVQTTDTGTINETREYRAVGIQLRARPRITVNRDVDLRVNLELSSISPTLSFGGQFVVDRRETTTQLIVRDGQTVVISGILRSEDSDVKRKVPLLGDIPLIGLLFTSIETETTNTELVAFITPRVIDNTQDLPEFNRPFNERLNQLRQRLGKEEIRPIEGQLAPETSDDIPPPVDPDDDPRGESGTQEPGSDR